MQDVVRVVCGTEHAGRNATGPDDMGGCRYIIITLVIFLWASGATSPPSDLLPCTRSSPRRPCPHMMLCGNEKIRKSSKLLRCSDYKQSSGPSSPLGTTFLSLPRTPPRPLSALCPSSLTRQSWLVWRSKVLSTVSVYSRSRAARSQYSFGATIPHRSLPLSVHHMHI